MSTQDTAALKACKDASDALKNTITQNLAIQQRNSDKTSQYMSAHSDWSQRQQNYLSKLNNWKTRTGEFASYMKYDGVNREFWAKETDGTCWGGENWNAANDWCHGFANKKGYDGENYWAKDWGWCDGRWGNFKCKKPDDIVRTQQAAYNAAMPTFNEPEPRDKEGDFAHESLLPIDANISCCTNVQNIISSKLSNSSLDQANECSTSIETNIVKAETLDKIKQAEQQKKQKDQAAEKLGIQSETTTTTTTTSNSKSTSTTNIRIVILIIMCILLSSMIGSSMTGALVVTTSE